MNWSSIYIVLRVLLLLGAFAYLGIILWLLKTKRLTVRYSIIWLFSALALLIIALFPYIVLVLTQLLGMSEPIHLVFLVLLAFVLLQLLCLSSTVSGFSERLKRITQQSALLERRVRELEKTVEELQRSHK
jgi:hypothetical protein